MPCQLAAAVNCSAEERIFSPRCCPGESSFFAFSNCLKQHCSSSRLALSFLLETAQPSESVR